MVTNLFALQSGFLLLVSLVLLGVKVFALVDAVTRTPAQFVAADKQSKQMWLILLVIALVGHLVQSSPLGLLNLIGTVAALVYLADARPALKQVSGRR